MVPPSSTVITPDLSPLVDTWSDGRVRLPPPAVTPSVPPVTTTSVAASAPSPPEVTVTVPPLIAT
jgi:hypothetical protein